MKFWIQKYNFDKEKHLRKNLQYYIYLRFSQLNFSMQRNGFDFTNKTIPDEIRQEALIALSHYPELKDTPLTFKFKKSIRKSTMQAQPTYDSIFRKRKNRRYIILISERFHIEDKNFQTTDVPHEVMIGWLGHELGHVMDYRQRSFLQLISFGFRYLFSKKYLKHAERTADLFAVQHGMHAYIVATKNFILENVHISPTYKARIERLYMSPEEIMEIVNSKKQSLAEEVEKEEKERTPGKEGFSFLE